MTKNKTARIAAGLIAAVGVFAVTACGGGSDTGNQSEGGLEEVTIAIPPNVNSLGIRTALEEGLFEDAGLDVELVSIQSGSEGGALLAGGGAQFANFGVHNAILSLAEGHGTPITVALTSQTDEVNSEPHGFGSIVVAAGGDIQTPKDLEGKKIGTSVLGGEAYLNAYQKLEALGVDASSIEWIQIPGPQQVSSVNQGQVDAAITPEPNASIAFLAGTVEPLLNTDGALPGSPANALTSDAEWAEENPEIIEAVESAVLEANAKLNSDRELAERMIATSMDLDEEVIKMVKLPVFAEEPFTIEGLEQVSQRLLDFGLLTDEKKPDLEKVFYSGGRN